MFGLVLFQFTAFLDSILIDLSVMTSDLEAFEIIVELLCVEVLGDDVCVIRMSLINVIFLSVPSGYIAVSRLDFFIQIFLSDALKDFDLDDVHRCGIAQRLGIRSV